MRLIPYLLGLLIVLGVLPASGQKANRPGKTPTYWLGTRDGSEIRFLLPAPADAVEMVLRKTRLADGIEGTAPRYRSFTLTPAEKPVVIHTTEIAWEAQKLEEGLLTWVVDTGVGIDWQQCDITDPRWPPFARALKALAVESEGWSYVTIFLAETRDIQPPSIRLNRDGTTGPPTVFQQTLWKLTDLNSKPFLSEEDMAEVRAHLLTIANLARLNPAYRRENHCKTALDLPKGLKPLRPSDRYNRAAQQQAEYCALRKEVSHEQPDLRSSTLKTRLKALGSKNIAYEVIGAGLLQEYPMDWLSSETHYRPWWNLDGQTVAYVGFGIARGADGLWYLVAVLGNNP